MFLPMKPTTFCLWQGACRPAYESCVKLSWQRLTAHCPRPAQWLQCPAGGAPEGCAPPGAGSAVTAADVTPQRAQVCLPPGAGRAALQRSAAAEAGHAGLQVTALPMATSQASNHSVEKGVVAPLSRHKMA